MNTATASRLIESLDRSVAGSDKKKTTQQLPSPIDFFRLGLILSDLQQREVTHNNSDVRAIRQQYHELLGKIESRYLKDVIFRELNTAFTSLTASNTNNMSDVELAVQSLNGLYSNSSIACQIGWSLELCSSLASVYDRIQQQDSSHRNDLADDAVLNMLSSLIMDGLLIICEGDDEENQLRRLLEVVQVLSADTRSNVLGNMIAWQEQRADSSTTLVNVVQSRFEESPQREYLLMMLQVSRDEVDQANVVATSSMDRVPKEQPVAQIVVPTDPAAEIRRRVQQVRDVLPDLGEGYIETVLSYFQGDVQRTIAALLEGDASELPPALRMLDQKLPARRRETPQRLEDADEEARQVVKERLAEIDRREKAEALAFNAVLGEYDDDYDDQYDGMDGGEALGNTDSGLYDYEMIRTYNKVALQIEREDAFWEQNRNLNRKVDDKKQVDEKEEDIEEGGRQYRGPDKGRGGRLIGPDGKFLPQQKGGSKVSKNPSVGPTPGTNNQTVGPTQSAKAGATPGAPDANNTMSSNQRRYKNNNKAKIGNHNRKDRAIKKAGGGA